MSTFLAPLRHGARYHSTMSKQAIDNLESLKRHIREFSHARQWERYHTPKNVAMAMIVEAAELLEHFQWLTPEESTMLPTKIREDVRLEMADVLIYLVRLADLLEIDLLDAAADKLVLNAEKYPVDQHP